MSDQSSQESPRRARTFRGRLRSFTTPRHDEDRVDLSDPLRYVEPPEIRSDLQKLFSSSTSPPVDDLEWDKAIILAKIGSRAPPVHSRSSVSFTEEELAVLEAEKQRVSSQSGIMLIILTVALAAFLQGHVQSSINSATLFAAKLGVETPKENEGDISHRAWTIGGMNASPYLAAALLGTLTSLPTNYYIGRRGSLIVSAVLIIASSLASAFCRNWKQLLGVRIIGGIGMGVKAISAPILAAETANRYWRGSILITWQLWVACGILMGFIVNLIIVYATNVDSKTETTIENASRTPLQLILGAPAVPAFILLVSVYFCYESPRFYMRQQSPNFDPPQALKILLKIREHRLQALRDIILIRWSEKLRRPRNASSDSQEENATPEKGLTYASQLQLVFRLSITQYRTLLSTPRLRNAIWSTCTVALAQQLCGINVFAFYSSTVFSSVSIGEKTISDPMLYSLGFGLVNFFFCLPAMRTIDTSGRRAWLLVTLPIMAVLLAAAAGAFPAHASSDAPSPNARSRTIVGIVFIYLFVAVYSPGLGPIPFTLASESFPLSHREAGASVAISTNLFFAGILTIIIPAMNAGLTTPGLVGFFSGANMIAFVLVFFIVEETRQLSLEDLEEVYAQPKKRFAGYQMNVQLPYLVRRYVMFRKNTEKPPSYDEWVESLEEEADMEMEMEMNMSNVGERRVSNLSHLH